MKSLHSSSGLKNEAGGSNNFLFLPYNTPEVKVFRIILALYIAFLTTMPCVDLDNSCHARNSGEMSVSLTGSHSQEHHDFDACSPFCVCNCCQVNVLTQSISLIEKPYQVCISTYVAANLGHPTEIPLPFWQPPKVFTRPDLRFTI